MIELIASDMDGTLLNDEGNINHDMYDLISSLSKKNIMFAAASGRSYSQLSNHFNKSHINMLLIGNNGAIVKYNNNGPTIYMNSISEEHINHVVNLDGFSDNDLLIAGEEYAYVINPSEELLKIFKYYKLPWKLITDVSDIDEPILKLTYFISIGIQPYMMDYLKSNLSEDLEYVASGDKWIDIMNKGVSKGAAIKFVQDKFNISNKNTMVFGDYYNDLSMFKMAHFSYAMENAPEDVKRHAKFIAENNNKNGVYKVICNYFNSI